MRLNNQPFYSIKYLNWIDMVGILLKDRIFSETYKSLDLYIFDKKRAKFRFTYAYWINFSCQIDTNNTFSARGLIVVE
jgi:hypothetical protein